MKIVVLIFLKPGSQKRRNVNRKFKIVRIGKFGGFQRYQMQKMCGII